MCEDQIPYHRREGQEVQRQTTDASAPQSSYFLARAILNLVKQCSHACKAKRGGNREWARE